ncbi:MAG: M20/M25/M40 family metallo-hydrolase [Vulcanimicrobiota bacterium]
MKVFILGFLCLLLLQPIAAQQVSDYQQTADSIVEKARTSELGWARLSTICTLYPHRLSGTTALEEAIDWVLEEMEADGFDRVTTQEVIVPHWERGVERLTVLKEKPEELTVMALGGSVSTPAEGIEAELLVVESYEELDQRREEARGKIVVFNVPFTTYGETVGYRITGASRAADAGAVAALLRSVTPNSLATPHTGVMYYDKESNKVPFGAITPEAAMHFHRLQEKGVKVKVRLVLETREYPDAVSRNVIAEIRGSEYPEEVIVLGGHIDGWDIGEGAHDDAGGCLMTWEALRILKDLGLKPKRTIRVVLWTNEENGLQGARAYRDLQDLELKNHVLAIESDYGTFHPTGYAFSGQKKALETLQEVLGLLKDSVGEMSVRTPGGGADIGPLMKEGVPGAALTHQSERYFWYHHSPADTLDKIDQEDFRNCVATLAVTVYVVADLPTRLPFGIPEDK